MSVIPEEHEHSFNVLFDYIYKGDDEASRVSLELVRLVHVWDDLIDQDVQISAVEINAAFLAALCEIGGSWLWDAKAAEIARLQFFKWMAANDIEANPDATTEQRMISYSARAGFYELFYYFAYKLHGMQWATEVASVIASWYAEPAKDYIDEFWGKNG